MRTEAPRRLGQYEEKANLEVNILFTKLNLILFCKNQQYMFRSGFIFKTRIFVFLTNMHVNLACQTSFSLGFLGIFFPHDTNIGANIVQRLYFFPFLPSRITNLSIYWKERKTKVWPSAFTFDSAV